MIQINKIRIKNFRQYRSLELAFPDDKGIYLFIGKNGMGKSNFLNAICWCLYEDMPFRAHDNTDNKLNIYNEESLNASDSKVILAEVELEVTIDKTQYKFQRKLHNLPVGNTNTDFKAFRLDNGDWQLIPNATHYIDNFLPRSLRQFFLFDGEGVRGLFKGDYSTNLKMSIWKVSHIDLLNTTINHLDTVASELRKTLALEMPELESTIQAISEHETLIQRKKSDLFENSKQKKELELNLHKISQRYKEHAKYRELQIKRESLENEKHRLLSQLEDIRRDVTALYVSLGPFVFVADELSKYTSQIGLQRDKGTIPASIKPTLINDLLETKMCICGRHISPAEESHLHQLLNQNQEADKKEFLVDDGYILGNLNHTISSSYESLLSKRKTIRELEQQNENIERELKEISDNLVSAPEAEIGNIETQIRIMHEEGGNLAVEASKLVQEIQDYEQKLKESKDEVQKMAETQEKLKKDTQKLSLLESTVEKAKKVRDKVIDQVRKNVSFHTNQYFHDLMWKSDFTKLEFTDGYKIIIQKEGVVEPIDHTRLSNGETKVLGFATIKALTELSGFENFPAFIDAPVEQLDQQVEKNLLDLLPNFMPEKQVFVFSLDGENIVEFGKEKIPNDRLFKLVREPNSLSSKIVNYYGN
ncbi:AAA family ATPase [Candidatus Saccharibacteria bacterium]|nr:AAA family ATPase [Candidatus Saccharibacteria bacterium]